MKSAVKALLEHPLVNDNFTPRSEGNRFSRPDNPFRPHTCRLGNAGRLCFTFSSGWNIRDSGVFWPVAQAANIA